MAETLFFIVAIALIILVMDTRKTVKYLRDRIDELESRSFRETAVEAQKAATKPVPEIIAEPVQKVAAKQAAPDRIVLEPAAQVAETPSQPAKPAPSFAKRFEDLIGGKLPIWVGGISLVVAGVFLVRFSIEAGLFGPTARCITAALFGILLIGLAEFGHRIPRFGRIFTDDARIGHSIAGAGIAILYATLYMASELYGLLGMVSALTGVIAVTVLAFWLSQKHGPATALMGLLGGFAAPYVAGLGADSIAPLLIYLGVFTAGLFGLAIHRGWAWLALLATGGSIIWTTWLIFTGLMGESLSGDMPFVGIFVVLLAIGGVLSLSRTRSNGPVPVNILRALPLAAGFVQLAVLAPLIEFSPMAWLFFGALSVFAIALAWKDDGMVPAAASALGLMVAMVAIAAWDYAPDAGDLLPAAGFALLFGITGHLLALREKSGWQWALIGIASPTAILAALAAFAELGWSNAMWGAVCAVIAATTALMAWRTRAISSAIVLPIATAVTAILSASALWLWLPGFADALVPAIIIAALAWWAQYTDKQAVKVEAGIAAAVTGLFMAVEAEGVIEAMFASLIGETDLYTYLPDIGSIFARLLPPALVLMATAYLFRNTLGKAIAGTVTGIAIAGLASLLYLLFKQPLQIGPPQQFIQYGFAERAVMTNLLALGGWLLLRQKWQDDYRNIALMLAGALGIAALFRFIYFDLFMLSPTSVKQMVGPAAIANLGTLHFAAMTLWLWLFARSEMVASHIPKFARALDIASLLAAIAAVMITVRQAVHGSDIATPPYSSTETYLYSAALLILAVIWMVRGIKISSALLRIAGLVLLTLITFKVFLFDARQLEGVLRILSFLGLGIALIGIGWIYGKVMGRSETEPESEADAPE